MTEPEMTLRGARVPIDDKNVLSPAAVVVAGLSRQERLAKANVAATAQSQHKTPRKRASMNLERGLEEREDLLNSVFGFYDVSVSLNLAPSDAWILARFANGQLDANQLQPALDAARVSLAADPRCWLAHAVAGCVLARQGEAREALQHYLQVQQLQPTFMRGWVDAAELRLSLGEYVEAAADLQRANTMDPTGETPAGKRVFSLVAKTMMSLERR